MNIKKITFLGNFEVSYSSENDYVWTLEKLGIQIVKLQENKASCDDVFREASQSDAFFWVHTHGWNTPGIGMKEILRRLKELNIPSFGYHLDLYVPANRYRAEDEYWDLEYFFSVDKLFVKLLNETKRTNAFYLPPGVVERDCFFGRFDQSKAHDVIFVGSYGYHKEWPYRPQLIDWLKRTYGDRFAHYGGDGKGTIRGNDLNDLYASSKIVVGDTFSPNFDYPDYWSDRIFETTGRGGFIIHPYIKGLENYFGDRKEAVFYEFGRFDQLKALIDYYLAFETERKEIQMHGALRTLQENTYTQRLQYIMDTLQK